MLRQILWCLCLGTGSDPKLQEQIRTSSFNELKSLGACPKTSDFSLRLHGFARRLATARGMKLSLSEQGRRTLSSLLSHAKRAGAAEAYDWIASHCPRNGFARAASHRRLAVTRCEEA